MPRPKKHPDALHSITISGKVSVAEKRAIDELLRRITAERKEAGDVREATLTDWLRGHLWADAKARGIPVE